MLIKYNINTSKTVPNIKHQEVHKLTLTFSLTAHWSKTTKKYLNIWSASLNALKVK